MSDEITGRECRHCDSTLPLERVGLRFVCPCCSRAADDELPAGRAIEPAPSGAATTDTGEFSPAGRQAHEAPETAQDGAQATIAGPPDAEPALDVAAVLDALKRGGRDPVTGQFVAGHVVNLRHGRRAPRLWAAGPLREALAEREAAVLADLGGAPNLSAVERPLVREFARLALLVEAAGERLIRDGLESSKGRTRAAASLYAALLDKQMRLASMLGLQRRARPAASLADWAATARTPEAGS